MLAIIYTSSQSKTCITHLQWISGINPITKTLCQFLPCRNRGKGWWKLESLSPAEQTHHIWVQATSRTVRKGTCWCCWQSPCLYLVEALFAGLCTQAVSCVARKLRAGEKKKLLCLQAAKFWITVLRDRKGQMIPHFFIHRRHLLYVFYYFNLPSFRWSISVGLANCHKRLFCRGILLFLRNSVSQYTAECFSLSAHIIPLIKTFDC